MKTELEKCLAGEPFNGGDKVLADMTLNAKRLLKRLNETDYADTEQRKRIFHDLFGKMGEHVHIDIDFHCEYGKHIFIGDQVIINMNCTFVDNNIIEIGDNVLIASNVQIYTARMQRTLKILQRFWKRMCSCFRWKNHDLWNNVIESA